MCANSACGPPTWASSTGPIWSRGQGRSLVDELEDADLTMPGGRPGFARHHQGAAPHRRDRAVDTVAKPHSPRALLVVIDEAHNVCPSKPADPVTALATNYAALIAAEGRKFGLYLLTSTQRPQKVNEEVLSQCDNLLLMRMNSEADLGYLRDIFSFVPPGLIQTGDDLPARRDAGSRQVLPPRDYVKFGARISQEGGADIPTAWAAKS